MIDKQRLEAKCSTWNISLTGTQLDQLDAFAQILVDYNQKVNLTAITDPEGIEDKHFLDSLLFASQPEVAGRMVDVGAGAGFPGIVTKIYKPELELTLMEPTGKRVEFLKYACAQLGLTGVEFAKERAEEAARKVWREQFDLASARAVAALPMLAEYCLPLVKVGGNFLAMKGASGEEELAAARGAIKKLGGAYKETRTLHLPGGDTRTLILCQKISQTPTAYPRNGGKIAKSHFPGKAWKTNPDMPQKRRSRVMFERKKAAGKIYFLPIDQIHPSPFQARRTFEEQELAGLAQSIRENGLLQPISVRKAAEGYELVAGERRLRACKLAQMTTIPAILCSYADEQTAALGLLENIQRTDLNPFEQAQGLRDILVLWDCTQAEAAKRLGMAQPTLANKLRLLQLTGDQRQFVLDNNLTERHARAVLRLPENRRSEALINIAKRRLNARQTDLYIEQLLNSTAKGRHRISMVRDVRIFVNTIDHAIRLMTDNGVPATAHREEKDGYIEYTVRIPTAAAEK